MGLGVGLLEQLAQDIRYGLRAMAANKTFSAMTSAQNPHGGQETTLQTLYVMAMHWGAILVPPGYTDPSKFVDGNPYGASHISANGANRPQEQDLTAVAYSATRAVQVAQRLKG